MTMTRIYMEVEEEQDKEEEEEKKEDKNEEAGHPKPPIVHICS